MAERVLRELRYHLFLCDEAGEFCGCQAAGAAEFRTALRRALADRGLTRFVKTTIMTCNQPGVRGPVLVVYPDGIWYDGLTVEDIPRFLDEQILAGRPLEDKLLRGPLVTGQTAY
jgi:(2Fe-2S) ferredoxin